MDGWGPIVNACAAAALLLLLRCCWCVALTALFLRYAGEGTFDVESAACVPEGRKPGLLWRGQQELEEVSVPAHVGLSLIRETAREWQMDVP